MGSASILLALSGVILAAKMVAVLMALSSVVLAAKMAALQLLLFLFSHSPCGFALDIR